MFSQIFPINLKPQASQVFGAFQPAWKRCHVNILRSWEMEVALPHRAPPRLVLKGLRTSLYTLTLALMLTRVSCLPLWTNRPFYREQHHVLPSPLFLSLLSFLALALAPSPPLPLFSSSEDRFKECAKVPRLCLDEKPSYFNYNLFLKILF